MLLGHRHRKLIEYMPVNYTGSCRLRAVKEASRCSPQGMGCFHQVGGAPEGLTCTNSKNQTTRGKGQLNTDPKYLSKKGIKEFCGVGAPGSGSGRFLVPGGD